MKDEDFSWLDDEPLPKERKDKLSVTQKRTDIGQADSEFRRSMTDAKWKKFLELSANGIKRKDVLRICNITKETFDAHLIESVNAGRQLREADAAWLRRSWPLDDIEQMLNKIALGSTVKAASIELGYDEKRLGSFYRLVRTDPRIRDLYDVARELQAESWFDDIIDISDNRGDDTFIDHKGNQRTDHGVIQRDRLRVDVRQWGMGAINRKRFGEHKHIDHGGDIQVNHAVQLANARKRLETVRQPVTIDNSTQQVVGE